MPSALEGLIWYTCNEMGITVEASLTQRIRTLKESGQYEQIGRMLTSAPDETTLRAILEHLGRLPADFPRQPLVELLSHPNPTIRLLAIKNLAKLKETTLRYRLYQIARHDPDSFVRREAVSALGRMRCPEVIPLLQECLQDQDPKVILQAIRGLLYFRDDPAVRESLERLRSHPNELIQSALRAFSKIGDGELKAKPHHRESPDILKNLLVNADVRQILPHIPNESVHLTFTSPPYYNARDYTIYQSYEGYLQFLADVFREVHRITKEGRFFVLNTSPVLVPRMSRQHASRRYAIPFDIHPLLTAMGWEFIDDIIWVKPEPSAKNRNGGFYQHRKPLAYKPNCITEYVMVYRKKTDKLIDWNIRQYPDEVIERSRVLGDYEKTNVWKIAPTSDKLHPAVFPLELAARVIQLYSYEGDLVFDPFAGVGTVGAAAISLNRYFLLAEQEPVYAQRAYELLQERSLMTDVSPRCVDSDTFIKLVCG